MFAPLGLYSYSQIKNIMKKLITIILLIVLISCGTALERPKSNTDYKKIIGKPINIGNLVVAQYDFPKALHWDDAKKACETIGDGWRLPTKHELNTIYINRDKIGRFSNLLYWSSTEYASKYAWGQYIDNGNHYVDYKSSKHYVRAVRSY